MRLATAAGPAGPRLGVVADGGFRDVTASLDRAGLPPAPEPMLRLLRAGPGAIAALAQAAGPDQPLQACTLQAPVMKPGKVVAIGRNYADHAAESGLAPPPVPRIIVKLPNAVCGPGTAVRRPPGVAKLDYEVELAVIIGRIARSVTAADALAHVAGYTILNDLSARDFQLDVSPAQTSFAKSMDGFAPMGPWLVTADELPDPQVLELSCSVNDERLQHASTAQMIFPVAALIAYISRFVTLEPGDVIATGTPAGCGAFRDPPRYLQPGDALRLEIAGIGVLEHTIA